jgi:hypothetical protein
MSSARDMRALKRHCCVLEAEVEAEVDREDQGVVVVELRKKLRAAQDAEAKRRQSELSALSELCEVRRELLVRQEELLAVMSKNVELMEESARRDRMHAGCECKLNLNC